MSNLVEKKELTQELIKETAMKLFFVRGSLMPLHKKLRTLQGLTEH